MQRTLSIIKPKSVQNKDAGNINAMIEASGLKIVAQKMISISKEQAQKFYIVHKEMPFYDELCTVMSSGPIIVQVLQGDSDVVNKYRTLMGATDPKKADKGTIRDKYGESLTYNAVHGSDSDENAAREISFFFSECEIFS